MKRNLIYIRLLGYLILYLLSSHWSLQSSGKGTSITTEIFKRKGDDEKLLELGKWYFNLYMRFFRYEKRSSFARYPEAVEFGEEFYATIGTLSAKLLRDSECSNGLLTHRFAKRKSLLRDVFCCILTGDYDRPCVRVCAEFEETLLTPGVVPDFLCITGCAHIIPPTIRRELKGYDDRFTWDSDSQTYFEELPDESLLSDLEVVFGYPGLVEELNGTGINRLENVLTLKSDPHYCFMNGDLWLIPDDRVGGYKVKSRVQIPYPEVIPYPQLKSSYPEIPRPSSEYLQIHGTIAEVAHLSGGSRYQGLITFMLARWPRWDSTGDDSQFEALPDNSLVVYTFAPWMMLRLYKEEGNWYGNPNSLQRFSPRRALVQLQQPQQESEVEPLPNLAASLDSKSRQTLYQLTQFVHQGKDVIEALLNNPSDDEGTGKGFSTQICLPANAGPCSMTAALE